MVLGKLVLGKIGRGAPGDEGAVGRGTAAPRHASSPDRYRKSVPAGLLGSQGEILQFKELDGGCDAFRHVLKPSAALVMYRAMDLIRIILAILLPPLGVFLQVGLGGHFWLNILLTLLGYIPGIVHAVWVIARR